VKSKDYDGLVSALKQAMTVPIPRTILPHMTQAEHELRMQALMETDWYDEAVQELERRKEFGGKVSLLPRFLAHHLARGKRTDDDGRFFSCFM
jgi:hypothetical protein